MRWKHYLKNKLYVFALIGALFFVASFWLPSGETAVPDHAISKRIAAQFATSWIEKNLATSVRSSLTMLQSDTTLSAALQHRARMAAYDKKFGQHYPIDYYVVELKTADHTYRVNVDYTKKQILGWQRLGDTDVPSSSKLAEQFLHARGFTSFTRLDSSNQSTLRYRLTVTFDDMPLIATIRTSGSKVIAYQTAFEVSKKELAWQDRQQTLRGKFETIGTISSVMLFLITIGLLIKLMNKLDYRRGWLLSLLFLGLQVLSLWNMRPALHLYTPWPHIEMQVSINLMIQTLIYIAYAGFTYLCFITGDYFWRGLKQKDETFQFELSPGIVYLLALGVLGFQSFIYVVGDYLFQVWSTNDPFFAMDNIALPELFPLSAWVAAISEEIVYRLFAFVVGVTLLRKFLPNKVALALAASVSSMLWALGHVGYPVFPAISRFVEVTLLGLLFCYIFYRFGLIAAIFMHAVIDSLLMAIGILYLPDVHSRLLLTGYIALLYAALPYFLLRFFVQRRVRSG
jgi:hypothetical protein